MATYSYNSVTIAVPAGGKVQAFAGNAKRVSLIVGSETTSLFRISTSGVALGTGTFISSAISLNNVYCYRDYGPIVQGEIWIENPNAAAGTFTVTEVYKISGC